MIIIREAMMDVGIDLRGFLASSPNLENYNYVPFLKKILRDKAMVFKNGIKSIQAVAYNGTHTVIDCQV